MRVFIIGIDGYLGWSLAQYLATRGHNIGGIDNLARRRWVRDVGSCSAIPIPDSHIRSQQFKGHFGELSQLDGYAGVNHGDEFDCDVTYYNTVKRALDTFEPDVVVHLGQMPSAPWSMQDINACIETHSNNDIGMLSVLWALRDKADQVPLVTIGSMGEYGTPECDIPEGHFEPTWRGKTPRLLFARQPASYYHATKVHCSTNIEAACRWWGLRATDIMQGVVYGTRHDAMPGELLMRTRFDMDEHFGTAINRFVAQTVIGEPMTVFGTGEQQRGFLPLRDSMQCLTLVIENAPKDAGEYRVVNQFDKVYSIMDLAMAVAEVAEVDFGLPAQISKIENPRVEAAKHYYNPDRQKLADLGYKPRADMKAELREMFDDLLPHKRRIEEVKEAIFPKTHWK
jgi:UDP-sulfoquinovose synthase